MFNVSGQAKFQLKENVEYKVINTRKFLQLLLIEGAEIDTDTQTSLDLNRITECAKASGIKDDIIYDLKEQSVRQVFQENVLGRLLTKHGIGNHSISKFGFLFGHQSNSKVIENLVVSAGKAGVASRINGSGAEAAFTYIAVGTGATAAAAGDTTLQTESTTNGSARAAATASRVTTTVTNDTAQLQLTFNLVGSFAFTEAGVLNAASVGTLLARQVFSAVNVVSGDSLQITWKFSVA